MSFNILDPKSNIFGKKVLQASAGTGKTFTIEHLVVRLILDEQKDFSIEQILVVTFTKAATKELKYRIRSNIEKALFFLKNNSETKGGETDIFNYLKKYQDKNRAITKLQDALDLFETAQIFTIHSFCYKVLKEFYLEADQLLLDENEAYHSRLIKDLTINFFKTKIDKEIISQEQLEILLKYYLGFDSLVNQILNSLDKTFKNENFKSFTTLFGNFNESLKNENFLNDNDNLDDILINFEKISKNYKKLRNIDEEEYINQIKMIFSAVKNKNLSALEFNFFIKTKLSIFDFLKEKNKKLKSSCDVKINNFFKKVKEVLYPFIEKATDIKYLFSLLTNEILKYIDEYLEKENILTFNKILYKLNLSLQNEDLLKKIQSKYKAAIIDEFQDTDEIQFEIFDKIFLSNENILAFYLIGDPKQSIYRFRNADLYTYLKATEKISNTKYLDSNFRSSKSLIASLNAIFSENFSKDWLKLPSKEESLKYLPIKATKEDFNFKDNLAPVHFFIAEDNYKVKKWPTDLIEEKYFSYITSEIIKLKKDGDFNDSSFAILVKDRFQAQRIKNYLQKNFIKANVLKNISLKNSKALKALKEFFLATLNPLDINKLKIAAKGPFFNFSDKQICEISNNSEIFKKLGLLKAYLEKGFGIFFNNFFSFSLNGKTVLENIALLDINFYHDTISLIEKILSTDDLTYKKIINFLDEFHLNELDDEANQSKESGDGCQVLTTFMSKGLEYDIVFALSLASRSKKQLFDNVAEIDAEKTRQLYVAATRAKYRVYLPLAIDLKEKPIENGLFSPIEYFLINAFDLKNVLSKKQVFEKLTPLIEKKHISYSFIDKINIEKCEFFKKKICLQKPKELILNFSKSSILSFSSIQKQDTKISDEEDFSLFKKLKENNDENILEDIFATDKTKIVSFSASDTAFNTSNANLLKRDKLFDSSTINLENKNLNYLKPLAQGTEIGVLFHAIFEKVIKSKSFAEENVKKISFDILKETTFLNNFDEICDIVLKTLFAPLLENENISLKDINFKDLKSEVEFFFSHKNNYIKGFIDLVFSFQDKYYIIDWKSNYLGDEEKDYSIENIEKSMSLHDYYLQASIYSSCLKKHLNLLKKDFDKHFGGVFYMFLRGIKFSKRCGIYHFFPDLSMLDYVK